jgi:hypothetical protein
MIIETMRLPNIALSLLALVGCAPRIYEFSCSVPAHLPMMHGQLVVLSADQLNAPLDRAMAIQIH